MRPSFRRASGARRVTVLGVLSAASFVSVVTWGASVAAIQGMAAGAIGAIAIGAAGIAFAPNLLAMMGASQGVISTGHLYAEIILGSQVPYAIRSRLFEFLPNYFDSLLAFL